MAWIALVISLVLPALAWADGWLLDRTSTATKRYTGAFPTTCEAGESLLGFAPMDDADTARRGKLLVCEGSLSGGTFGTPSAMDQLSSPRLLGRSTAGTGSVEQLTIGTGLNLSGGALSASGAGGTGVPGGANGDLQTRVDGSTFGGLSGNPGEVAIRDAADTGFVMRRPGLGLLSALDYGATPNNSADDDCVAFQAAHDAADAITGVPAVVVPAGDYHCATQLNAKARMIGAGPGNTRILWNGAAGATMVITAKQSFGGLGHLALRNGTAQPATLLDTTSGGAVDKYFMLDEVHFVGASGDAIKIPGFVNAHFGHLRFDGLTGGYALRSTIPGAQNKGHLIIDKLTYDHGSNCVCAAPGVFVFDLTGNPSNAGTVEITAGRIEVNDAWTAPKAFVELVKVASGGNARSLTVKVGDLTFDDVAGMADEVLHHITGAGGGTECLIVENLRGAFATSLGGDWSAGSFFPAATIVGFPFVSYNCGDVVIGGSGSGTLIHQERATTTTIKNKWFIGAEAEPRHQVSAVGMHAWGDGTSAVDTTLYRGAANQLKTDDDLLAVGRLASTPQAVSCADSGDANPGALTLQPTASVVNLTNGDAHGCTVTLSETSPLVGATVVVVVISSAGGTVNFSDTAGVSELSGAFNAGVGDTLTLVYTNNAWYEVGRRDN